jgi:hypothetical protein
VVSAFPGKSVQPVRGSQQRSGGHALGLLLGNVMYHVASTTARFTKFTRSFGPLKAIAQLQLEYCAGARSIMMGSMGVDAWPWRNQLWLST